MITAAVCCAYYYSGLATTEEAVKAFCEESGRSPSVEAIAKATNSNDLSSDIVDAWRNSVNNYNSIAVKVTEERKDKEMSKKIQWSSLLRKNSNFWKR